MNHIKYFFPSPFKNEKLRIKKDDYNNQSLLLDSGRSAIRIALRNLKLPKNSKVGIPAFCCESVENAVKDENLIPYFFDSLNDSSYWAYYSEEKIIKEKIQVIIITHLYGFRHPDTDKILKFCIKNNIIVIHDLAQSFGIKVSDFDNDIIIYSFGPGKSSTAALGGEIVNIKFDPDIALPKASLIQSLDSILFYYSRLYNNRFSNLIILLKLILNKFSKPSSIISQLSNFQKKKANEVKFLVLNYSDERKTRYNFLVNALQNSDNIKLTYNDSNGLYFKFVIFLPQNADRFISYLNLNKIPFYRLGPDIILKDRDPKDLPNFYSSYNNFVEISTERSIDMDEIIRIAELLKNYK